MTLDEILEKMEGVRPAGNGYKAQCPAHDDREASLGITEGEDGTILLKCYAGCDTAAVVDSLGLEWSDLFMDSKKSREPEAIYDYRDEHGDILFQAVRLPGKRFLQRHHAPDNPAADSDGWVWSTEGVRRVLYRLPDLLASTGTVYVTEGEKDADALVAAGKTATCNPGGAGKWRPEYTESLRGRYVLIVQDKDEPGRAHAHRVRDELRDVAREVHIIEAREGKDAADHLLAGFAPNEMREVQDRAHRGIVTARELAERARLHLRATPESEPEFIIPDLGIRFRNGRVYLVGGYTGDGKTNLMLQCARNLCAQHERKVGIFSLEMTEDDLRNRLIAHRGIPLFRVERPWEMSDNEKAIYKAAVAEIAEWPLEIIYETAIDAERIDEITRDREYEIVFIDHIHRFSWGRERRKLEEQVQKLTNLTLEYNIPLVVLSQLRRHERGNGFVHYPQPTLQDFRDTEMLGAESSQALAIWRERDERGQQLTNGASWLLTLKNRYGQTGGLRVRFDPETMQFTTHSGRRAYDDDIY